MLSLLQSNYDQFKTIAESQSLATEFITPTVFIGIATDIKIIGDVLTRLFDNALKFTHQGSIILRLVLSADEKDAIISVEDTGIGIPEGNLEKIFTEFSHLQENVSGVESGAGIGLNIARKELALLQGTISVNSKVDQGTCFIITLPRRQNIE